MPQTPGTLTLQLILTGLTVVIAILNVILLPLVKSALRGEAFTMFEKHNEDTLAHPGLTMASREAVTRAENRATEAAASATRDEAALAELRLDVRTRFDAQKQRLETLGEQLRSLTDALSNLKEAFVEHDTWERSRYDAPPPKLRKRRAK